MVTQNARDTIAYTGLFDGLSKIWQKEGLSGLYAGIIPAMVGVSHGALQFMAYEYLKEHRNKTNAQLGPLDYITMASASKIFASVTCYPYQVVKSRMQVQQDYVKHRYSSVFVTVKTIYSAEGILGFYKGLAINTLRVLPGTCITFLVYETLSKTLRDI
jgi:solute carrier family 25 folate transporter 32